MPDLKKKILFCFEILLCISLQCTFYDVDRRPSKDGWLLLKVEINLFTESVNNITKVLLGVMSEKLCLQWNDFRENVNSSFGSLRTW